MTTYDPVPGVYVGRPPCVVCGAAYRLHRAGGSTLVCPVAYRPATIAQALADLRGAMTRDDANELFIARGEVQRLTGHRLGTCLPLCAGCSGVLELERIGR